MVSGNLCALVALMALASCFKDETVSGYADPEAVYRLEEISGSTFPAAATITFPEEGTVAGEGPCNHWSASQSAPYPWFEIGPILSTKRACADLDAEARFFEALGTMTLVETQGALVLLSNDEDQTMVFRQSDQP